MPSAARTFASGGSRPVTGSNIMAAIHFSLLNVTCESILKPPQTFSRKKGRYCGSVDQDSRPCKTLPKFRDSSDGQSTTHRGYNARNQNHRIFSAKSTLLHCHPYLKFSTIVVEFPDFWNAISETRPFCFNPRKVKSWYLRDADIISVDKR